METAEFNVKMEQITRYFTENPIIPCPEYICIHCDGEISISCNMYGDNVKERMIAIARHVGKTIKEYTKYYFTLKFNIAPGIICTVQTDREKVCKKIETKKIIPAQPERLMPAQPEREETEVEWICEPLLKETE